MGHSAFCCMEPIKEHNQPSVSIWRWVAVKGWQLVSACGCTCLYPDILVCVCVTENRDAWVAIFCWSVCCTRRLHDLGRQYVGLPCVTLIPYVTSQKQHFFSAPVHVLLTVHPLDSMWLQVCRYKSTQLCQILRVEFLPVSVPVPSRVWAAGWVRGRPCWVVELALV